MCVKLCILTKRKNTDRLFKNVVLIRFFEYKREGVTGSWGGSNCDLLRSHVTGSNDATLGEVG
jgi:hypothetical protein